MNGAPIRRENSPTAGPNVGKSGSRGVANLGVEPGLSIIVAVISTVVGGLDDPKGIAAALRGMAVRSDASDLLPQINVPTLIIVGEHDSISTVDEMRGIADAIPESGWVMVPGSGHMTPLENPAVFNDAVSQFLSGLPPQNAGVTPRDP